MSFETFKTEKMDEYAKQAKNTWGGTAAYQEFQKKSQGRSHEEEQIFGIQLMDIFAEFGKIRDQNPACSTARELVLKVQEYITEHYYMCTDEILKSLGQMYAGGGDMTANIDKYAGQGTGVFANKAIEAYFAK